MEIAVARGFPLSNRNSSFILYDYFFFLVSAFLAACAGVAPVLRINVALISKAKDHKQKLFNDLILALFNIVPPVIVK